MATIEVTAEVAQTVARLSIARQEQKDAQAKEDAAKEQIEAQTGAKVGDVLTVNGVPILKVQEGTRSGLDAEIVKRRAPGAYRQAQKITRFRKYMIVNR